MKTADFTNIEFPEKMKCLFQPKRYKVFYGGRGGAKSWGVARALLILGAQKPMRFLCAREFMNSIDDSSHALLSDQVHALGLDGFYEVQARAIIGRNGTEFSYRGLRHNIQSLKSFENADICWVEEAVTVSKTSWDVLIPTIRAPGSEIWITYNPELESDETHQRFVVRSSDDTVAVKMGWRDNPWFPEVLRKEKDKLKERDYDAYLHVWEGNCRQTLDGAIYAKELRAVTEEGRVTDVPYDRTKPVSTFWDLGHSDHTAIWFVQKVGFEYRAVDYYQNTQHALDHYLQAIQRKNYVYDTDWLPHDGEAKTLGTGRSIQEMMVAAGRKVRIVPKLSLSDGINAARLMFPNVWFDKTKTADGLQCLRHYQWKVDKHTGQYSREPLHNEASHGADAFRYFAVAFKDGAPKSEALKKLNERALLTKIVPAPLQSASWLGR